MRKTDSKVSDKSGKSTGKRFTRNNSRVIDDVDGPNLEKLTAPSAKNLRKTASDFLESINTANATIGKPAGVLKRGNSSNIFGTMHQLSATRPNPHFGSIVDRTNQAMEMFKKNEEDFDLSEADSDENVPTYPKQDSR